MGSGLPSQRQCTALLLLLPSAFVDAAAPTITDVHWRRGPSSLATMSVGPTRKSVRGVRIVATGRDRKGRTELGTTPCAMPCFFCKEGGASTSVTASLLESIMKVKAYMCIPLQLRDQAASDIVLCVKCLDIVSQIEGWVDLLRQRIFDAHEGAVLYPETPPWLQALAAAAPRKGVSGRAPQPPLVALAKSPAPGEKRKSPPGVAPVPPKKLAVAAAAGGSCLTLPEAPGPAVAMAAPAPDGGTARNAMRSAIDSLTTLVNVVRSSGRPEAAAEGKEVLKEVRETVAVKEEPSGEQEERHSPCQPFDIAQRWCAVCSSSYHNDSVFKRHIVSIHPELCFKCELCGQLFATAGSRDIHVSHGCCDRPSNRTRVLRCTDCHLTFLGKYELKRHVLLTGHMGGVSGQTV